MRKIIKVSWFLYYLVAILGFELSPAVSAGSKKAQISHQAPWRVIRLDPRVRQRYVPPPAAFSFKAEQLATADIQVNYIGSSWTPEVTAAFEFAVSIWESLITSPVTIEVDADFAPLGTNILGGAGPVAVAMDFDNAPQGSTWYPIATANKLAGIDLDPPNADIQASFSSTFSSWDYGTDGSTDGDKISFASVVLHELGHGLGFLGSMQAGSACSGPPGRGCFGINGFPMIYDLYTENGAGTALLDFPNNSTELYGQLTSDDLYFNSPGGNFANGGSRVPIYAPTTWSPGSSYSHLAESFNGTPQALMTYSIAFGETEHHPGAVTLCMFKEMGWTVSETCSAGTDDEINGLTAGNDGPTLLGEATQLSATILSGSNVTYAWDFGDQTGGSGAYVSHTYGSPGEYTAEVTATNSVSQVTATTAVLVEGAVTGLVADNDSPTLLGEATQLSASILSGSNVIYAWDFGDQTGGSGASVSHTYGSPGEYTAEVTATNSVSQVTATTAVLVEGAITGLAADNDSPTLFGEATQLSASILSGSNVIYAWDFGDQTGGSGAAVSHTYGSPGEYTAEVTATNSVSQVTAATVVLVEGAIEGLAAANDGPTMLGTTTQLSATVASGSNVIFAWDFGDETNGSGATVLHTYSAPGFYIAEVTATNAVSELKAETIVEITGELQFAFLPLIERP